MAGRSVSNMSSSSREEIVEVFDALDAELDRLCSLTFDALTTPERVALLERCERIRRRLPVVEHPLINQLARQATAGGIGWQALARDRRMDTDQPCRGRPAYPRSRRSGWAARADRGAVGAGAGGHRGRPTRRETRGRPGRGHPAASSSNCPAWVDAPTRAQAEADLARIGTQQRPEPLAKFADRLTDYLNPDGTYTDDDRARRRGLTLGKQQPDGMSELHGWVSPELRATLEAMLAKLAAPGMCNPDDDTPVVGRRALPGRGSIGDSRSAAQRNHDALNAGLRALLASGELGQHNGLPASIIITTTLADLEAAAGKGLTGGGTPVADERCDPDGPSRPPLPGVFDKGKALALYHTKRLASPGAADRFVRQGPRLYGTGLRRARLLLRSPSRHRLRHLPHHRHQPADLRLRHQPHNSCEPAAGPPAKTPAATPNGSHPHTSNAANPAPTPSTTPKNCSATRTTTKRITPATPHRL